jgi:hypothetical protein
MSKQSKSARIRALLDQGYPVKVISKKLKCSPALVYQVRAYDKKKEKKWVMVETATSKEPIGIPKEVAELHNIYGHTITVTSPSKPSLFQRVKNWFMGV